MPAGSLAGDQRRELERFDEASLATPPSDSDVRAPSRRGRGWSHASFRRARPNLTSLDAAAAEPAEQAASRRDHSSAKRGTERLTRARLARRGRDTGGVPAVRVLAYVRVSSEEQADRRAGLEAQRAAIQRECEKREWKVVEVIQDAGFSAKDLKRPGVRAAPRRA
jgi:hypothetical protein